MKNNGGVWNALQQNVALLVQLHYWSKYSTINLLQMLLCHKMT